MNFLEAKTYLFEKLAPSKIMALASSVNDYVMVRNVSCLIYNDAIYFKTDKIFRKTIASKTFNNFISATLIG